MSTTTLEDFATALDVMFWGVLYPTLAVLPQMRARRSGHIVNMTSIGGMVHVPTCSIYMCQVRHRQPIRGPTGRTWLGGDAGDNHSAWSDAHWLLCAGTLPVLASRLGSFTHVQKGLRA